MDAKQAMQEVGQLELLGDAQSAVPLAVMKAMQRHFNRRWRH